MKKDEIKALYTKVDKCMNKMNDLRNQIGSESFELIEKLIKEIGKDGNITFIDNDYFQEKDYPTVYNDYLGCGTDIEQIITEDEKIYVLTSTDKILLGYINDEELFELAQTLYQMYQDGYVEQ